MGEKATVLVTAAGGIIGEGIIKSLRLANKKGGPVSYNILAADADPRAAGLYRADEGFIVPGAAAPDYVDRLVNLATENGVKAVFVGADEELAVVASAAERIRRESGAVAISNEPETIDVGSDKWRTYEFMKRNGLPCAESALPGEGARLVKEFGFPVVVKPRDGHGSEEFYVARGSEELAHAFQAIQRRGWHPMLQELLVGEDNEFTTGVTVGRGTKVLSSIAMRRSLKGGQTYKAFIDDFPEVRKAAEEVALRLGGSGPGAGWPSQHLGDELLQGLVDERAPVERRDPQLVLRVLDLVDTEDALEEVGERADGPALEPRGRGDPLCG